MKVRGRGAPATEGVMAAEQVGTGTELTTAVEDAVAVPTSRTGGFAWRERLANATGHVVAITVILLIAPVPCLVFRDHGYTWSLLIFLLPIVSILTWFHLTPRDELGPVRKAFWWTVALLVAMGWVLNFLFADDFFRYDNPAAVLGTRFPLSLPSVDGWRLTMDPSIPIEEFAFYGSGFVAMLIVYVWGCEDFFRLYQPSGYEERVRAQRTIFQPSWTPVLAVGALVLVATAIKAWLGPPGFPGYLVYLLAIPLTTTLVLGRVALPFINWRAYVFMLLIILANSVLWEVSLALPQGWWRYREEAMIGLFIGPWHRLPIEAVIVWFLAPIATVVTFEALKVFFHHPERGLGAHVSRAVEQYRRST
jgi:hypothetical protein